MKFHKGQSLYFVPERGAGYHVTVDKIGKRWLYCGALQIDRNTLELKAVGRLAYAGKAWFTRDEYVRYAQRHGAWRRLRQNIQASWGPPPSVSLEQIEAAADLLRLRA